MLNQEQITQAAAAIHAAEQERRPTRAVTLTHPDMSLDDAYRVQARWMALKQTEGRAVSGYKIGLTSRAMQLSMHIDEPDYGTLLDDMFFANGAVLDAAQYTDPRIEVELAFVLKERLAGAQVSVDDVMQATDYVVPALELIAARSYRVDPDSGYVRKVQDTISDNAAAAGVILGEQRIDPHNVDLRWCGAVLYRNEVVEETGLAAGVLDHPANGIVWIARRFAPHGIALEPGQVLLSGSFTRPVPARAGDVFRADYGNQGSIDCSFR
ncbi:MAG: 2-oxo-hepta-3-ene-1,7-dioic acid hydratase [Gammaproteobacteria bacterium]|nr:2-oxo-hepta-3-ene-1,7-dioic acid hydratase [Gammaproteobacteria bacterium]